MKKRTLILGIALIFIVMLQVAADRALAREAAVEPADKDLADPARALVLDGSFVHDAGMLRMHMSNWGLFGSMPSATFPFSFAPSAEWPAGSGVEYLYAAGVWIGGIVGGVPSVSTSLFEMELRPTADPIDIIYRTYAGAPGGARFPFPGADDDRDGSIDEDRLDGRDNDGDGFVDEDFAAISKQMFTSWYNDYEPASAQLYPQHRPLGIVVEQESYQWDDPRFDDFVGVTLKITNRGDVAIEQMYLGLFADFDAGARTTADYWTDDLISSWFGPKCTDIGPASLNVMYGYDADGDAGKTPGYLGCMLLGHTVDPLGISAPAQVKVRTYRVMSGTQPYENGGDPANDFQRYEVLASGRIDRNLLAPGDYRGLMSVGPFPRLRPGESIELSFGFVAGAGLAGMLENAASAQRLYDGTWYDVDRNAMTGIDGRESPVYGPAAGVVVDKCRPELATPIDVPAGAIAWVNADCEREETYLATCLYDAADSLLFRTGVGGDETQVHWALGEPLVIEAGMDIRPGSCPNPFNMIALDFAAGDNPKKGGVLPVAILGGEGFDAGDIDIATVRLEGVAPLDKEAQYEDVSRPVADASPCACTTDGGDGYLDLSLKFSNQEIALALAAAGPLVRGETRALTLTGSLADGTAFEAGDCVVFVGNPDREDRYRDRKPRLNAASPNPFNPSTSVSYWLPESGRVRISVFDVSGRLVAVLVDEIRPAGEHVVRWTATGLASGLYFCRLEAGDFALTQKITLVR